MTRVKKPDVQLYALPYSEHSSFDELAAFVKGTAPLALPQCANFSPNTNPSEANTLDTVDILEVVPTVNLSTRNEQMSYIRQWLKEAFGLPGATHSGRAKPSYLKFFG